MKIEISVDEVSVQLGEAGLKIAFIGGDPKNDLAMRKMLICLAYLEALRQKYPDTNINDQDKNALCTQFAEDHPNIADEFLEQAGDTMVSSMRKMLEMLEIRRQQIDGDLS